MALERAVEAAPRGALEEGGAASLLKLQEAVWSMQNKKGKECERKRSMRAKKPATQQRKGRYLSPEDEEVLCLWDRCADLLPYDREAKPDTTLLP